MVAENGNLESRLASARINLKQLLAGILIALNLIVIGPGSFIVSEVYQSTKQFREETDHRIIELEKTLMLIQGRFMDKEVEDCLPRLEFDTYRNQMVERLRYLDSKISGYSLGVD